MMLAMSLFFVFAFTVLVVFYIIPMAVQKVADFNQKRAQDFARSMDRNMETENITAVLRLYLLAPFVCAALGFILAPNNSLRLLGLLAGVVFGLLLPKFYANMILAKRRDMFALQLIDGLMIMSSSFRGGMSLVQSMEAVVEEMPDPIRHEFSIVLGENKMGVNLDEALNRLYKRMPSPAMQQMVVAILLSRETGGNLPVVFSRIVTTIRERRKIEENLKVLTMQGKLQALVMSGLPVAFFFMVNSSNPKYFDIMMTTDLGRMLLMAAVGLWLVGTFMIIKISSFDDF
jgi:tight adherence protein B